MFKTLVLVCVAAAAMAVEAPPHVGWRLIQTGPDINNLKWMSPAMVDELHLLAGPMHGTPYMDVTDHQEPPAHPKAHYNRSKVSVDHERRERVLACISEDMPRENLRVLTGDASSFVSRRHDTEWGVDSAKWIHATMSAYCLQYRPSGCSCELFEHTITIQPSVICSLKGSAATGSDDDPVVIIGAHEDSIAPTTRAPGADDDGSGTVTVMEAMRAILECDLDNKVTIEFQLYAAEEVGLWGSEDIASHYAQTSRNVKSMIQFDMNGCCSPESGLARGTAFNVCVDEAFTDAPLTLRLQDVITNYGGLPQGTFRYGYAASDHASFARNDFPACHVKENVGYPPIHSENDAFDNIDFEYLHEFVKVAVGFLAEEAEFV